MTKLGHEMRISCLVFWLLNFQRTHLPLIYWRDWGQEEKGTTEDGMAGWDHGLSGREFEWTPGVGDGQGGLACCNSWGRKEPDMTERLNWTDCSDEDYRWLAWGLMAWGWYGPNKTLLSQNPLDTLSYSGRNSEHMDKCWEPLGAVSYFHYSPVPRTHLSSQSTGRLSLVFPDTKSVVSRNNMPFAEGNGNLLQYSCLENPRDRGAWWAALYGVAQSLTQWKRLSSSSRNNMQFLQIPTGCPTGPFNSDSKSRELVQTV